jgi:hypothetical protein
MKKSLRFIFLCVLSLSALFVTGCYPEIPLPKNGKTVVRWDGATDLNKANYYINGKSVGTGLSGFDKVLSHLDKLEIASPVLIQYPQKWRDMKASGEVDDWWEFPFYSYAEKEEEFTAICGKKSLGLTFEIFDRRNPG